MVGHVDDETTRELHSCSYSSPVRYFKINKTNTRGTFAVVGAAAMMKNDLTIKYHRSTTSVIRAVCGWRTGDGCYRTYTGWDEFGWTGRRRRLSPRMAWSLASLVRRQMNEQKKVDDVNNRACNLGGSFDPIHGKTSDDPDTEHLVTTRRD